MDDAGGRDRHLRRKPEISPTEAAGPEDVGSGYRPPLEPEKGKRRSHQGEEKHANPQHHTGVPTELIHDPTPAFALRASARHASASARRPMVRQAPERDCATHGRLPPP